VFADGDSNVGGGQSDYGGAGQAKGWKYLIDNNEGLRMSIYWGANEQAFKDKQAKLVGQPVNITKVGFQYSNRPFVYQTRQTIYQTQQLQEPYKLTDKPLQQISSGYLSERLPVLWTNNQKSQANEQFMKNYFEANNYQAVAELFKASNVTNLTVKDFMEGKNMTRDGDKVAGIYKIYYQPLISFQVGEIPNITQAGSGAIFTLHDIIGFRQAVINSGGKDMIPAYMPQIIQYTANAAYLIRPDVTINMSANANGDLPALTGKNKDHQELVRRGIAPNGNIRNSMGVGVYTPAKKAPESIIKQIDIIDDVVIEEYNPEMTDTPINDKETQITIGRKPHEFVELCSISADKYQPFGKYPTDLSLCQENLKEDPKEGFKTKKETKYILVKWKTKKEIKPQDESDNLKHIIPQWRLSKAFQTPEKVLTSELDLVGIPAKATLNPSGIYQYDVENPNKKLHTNPETLPNARFNEYLVSYTNNLNSSDLHTKAHPKASIKVRQDLHYSKITKESKLVIAQYNAHNQNSLEGLKLYNIIPKMVHNENPFMDYVHNKVEQVSKLKDKNKYTAEWVGLNGRQESATINTKQNEYKTINDAYYEMYQPKDHPKYILPKQEVIGNKAQWGVSKIAFNAQSPTTMGIYPEVAMMFENLNNENSIKYVIGKKRDINPVSYHTINNFINKYQANTTGNPATDTRINSNPDYNNKSKFNKDAQVYLKGSLIQHSASPVGEQNLVTLTSYVLDTTDDVKKDWNIIDNPRMNHAKFLQIYANYNGANGKWYLQGQTTQNTDIISEKDNTQLYKGNKQVKDVQLEQVGGTTEKIYNLEVRGGVLVQKGDLPPREVLEKMKLIGNKDQTIFRNFERQQGKPLTEQEFITQAGKSRTTNDLALNKGWYNEDSTKLVIREFKTTFKAPTQSITMSDKLPLSINQLQAPLNKNYFTRIAKGGQEVSLDLIQIKANQNPYNQGNTIKKKSGVFSYFNFLKNNGYKGYYGVPNTSIQDRIN
jgi:hypothetical protein